MSAILHPAVEVNSLMPLWRIMKHPEIKSLYKYHGFNVNSMKCLIDEVVWFSRPASFNDPFDCGIYIDERKKEDTIQEVIDEQLISLRKQGMPITKEHTDINEYDIQAFDNYRSGIYELIQSIGVYCLSSCNNDILMWGHYADSHKGFCVEYERNSSNILGNAAVPVTYQHEFPSLTGGQVTSKGSDFDQLWTVKSKHWEYEKEWRVMSSEGGKAYQFPIKIKSIIFGARMSAENKYTLRKLLSDRSVSFKQAKIDKLFFALNIEDVET